MSVKQRGKTWQVTVGSGSDRYRATAQTEEIGQMMEQRELLRRTQVTLGQLQPEATKQKVEITLKRLYDLAKRRQWLNKGERQADNALLVLNELGENTSVHDVDRVMLHELVETFYEMGNSGATINRKLSSLSVLLTVAEDEGWIERAPKMPRQDENKHRIRFYNNAEEAEMMELCEQFGMQELSDFIIFAIDTGFRRSEVLGLAMRDCEDGYAVLHAGETKSGNARSVPLTQRAKDVVARRKALGYRALFQDMTHAQLRKRWGILRSNFSEAGDHFIVHTLRHTCASRLAMQGENATFIQTWMGHSSIMITQRYMHFAPGTLRKGTTSLDNYRKAA
jgi:integrase